LRKKRRKGHPIRPLGLFTTAPVCVGVGELAISAEPNLSQIAAEGYIPVAYSASDHIPVVFGLGELWFRLRFWGWEDYRVSWESAVRPRPWVGPQWPVRPAQGTPRTLGAFPVLGNAEKVISQPN